MRRAVKQGKTSQIKDMKDSEQREPPANLPEARVEHNPKTWFFWLVPLTAAALAAWFIYSDLLRSGPTIHIYFDNAAGLQGGKSQVKYRGANLGDVKEVNLTKDHQHVEITVALKPSAENIARQGSRFWIVKPEVGVEAIRGLRTIVSGDFVTVEPGGGRKQTVFSGLSEAPITDGADVLKVVLLSERGGSLKKRSPIFYRGIQVGEVFSSELGPESQAIQTTIHIKKHFAPLVRTNSKFWNAGGINMNLSLKGLDLTAQSAEALIAGGVEFATPATSEKEAPDGTLFRLYDKPDSEWLAWAPAIRLNAKTNAPEQAPNYSAR
jgi:paraquat-inducible protein B